MCYYIYMIVQLLYIEQTFKEWYNYMIVFSESICYFSCWCQVWRYRHHSAQVLIETTHYDDYTQQKLAKTIWAQILYDCLSQQPTNEIHRLRCYVKVTRGQAKVILVDTGTSIKHDNLPGLVIYCITLRTLGLTSPTACTGIVNQLYAYRLPYWSIIVQNWSAVVYAVLF